MKLEQGKWYVDRSGSRWHIDYVGATDSSGHNESGYIRIWHLTGRLSIDLEYQGDLVAEYKEPSIRPWNSMEEIPINAWFRHKGARCALRRLSSIVWLESTKVWHAYFPASRPIAPSELLQDYEHSNDGKNWLPCGVETNEMIHGQSTKAKATP